MLNALTLVTRKSHQPEYFVQLHTMLTTGGPDKMKMLSKSTSVTGQAERWLVDYLVSDLIP
jgi:hypothetical protein